MRKHLGIAASLLITLTIGIIPSAHARRPGADAPEIPLPPPSEILGLTSHDFTIPRQSVYAETDASKELNRKLPAEGWIKFRFDSSGKRAFVLVYCSSQDAKIGDRFRDIAERLILQPPPDSNSAVKWYYHRIVLLPNGERLQYAQNALPVPGDLPRPGENQDTAFGFPQIVRRGKLEIPLALATPGLDAFVLLRYRVGRTGKVEFVEVQTSSGSTAIDQVAIDAAYKYECTPATQHGKPVVGWISDRVVFNVPRKQEIIMEGH